MDESLQYMPKLFVNKMIIDWMFKYVKVVSQLSNLVNWSKNSGDMESMVFAREKINDIITYVDFLKFALWLGFFSDLNQTFSKEDITFPQSSSSISIEWRKIFWINYISMWIELKQACTKTSEYKKGFNYRNIYKLGC